MDVRTYAAQSARQEIAAQLKLRGISRRELAEKLGIGSPKVLYNMLNGGQRLRPEVVDQIRATLGMPADWPYNAEPKTVVYESLGPTDLTVVAAPFADRPGHYPVIVPALPGYLEWEAMRIPDDAFEPYWHQGDLILFAPPEQVRVFPGRVVVVRPEPDAPLLARVLGHDGKTFTLSGLNDAYPAQSAAGETLGCVVGHCFQDGSHLRIDIDPKGLRPSR